MADGLEERVTALETAVSELNRRLDQTKSAAAPARPDVGPGDIDFVLLERLQNREGDPFESDGLKGSIVYAGTSQTGIGTAVWHVERPVPGLLLEPAERYAPILALLGHPIRLQIVMTLLTKGSMGSVELQALLDGSSTGQFYHHLKELLRLNLVQQPVRGYYEVQKRKALPLIGLLAAALDLREDVEATEPDEVA